MISIPIPSRAHQWIALALLGGGSIASIIATASDQRYAVGFLISLILYLAIRRMRGRLSIDAQAIYIEPSPILGRTRVARTHADRVALRHVVERSRKNKVQFWEVAFGSHRLARASAMLEARAIAEKLAKVLRLPLVSHFGEREEITIAAADLDLPFLRRLEKYRRLDLSDENEAPRSWYREEKDPHGKRSISWIAFSRNSALVVLVGCGTFFLIGLLICVLPGKYGRPSLLSRHGTDVIVYCAAGFAALAVSILISMLLLRAKLIFDRDSVSRVLSFALIPVAFARVPYRAIEEVRIARGTQVMVISDERAFSVTSWRNDDRFLAGEIQRELRQRLER